MNLGSYRLGQLRKALLGALVAAVAAASPDLLAGHAPNVWIVLGSALVGFVGVFQVPNDQGSGNEPEQLPGFPVETPDAPPVPVEPRPGPLADPLTELPVTRGRHEAP